MVLLGRNQLLAGEFHHFLCPSCSVLCCFACMSPNTTILEKLRYPLSFEVWFHMAFECFRKITTSDTPQEKLISQVIPTTSVYTYPTNPIKARVSSSDLLGSIERELMNMKMLFI